MGLGSGRRAAAGASGRGGMQVRRQLVAVGCASLLGQWATSAFSAGRPHGATLERLGDGPVRVLLLLPPSKTPAGRPALAVRAGFLAAWRQAGRPAAVEIAECADMPAAIQDALRGAVARGVPLVVGPVTRDGVAALASLGPPPLQVLALNRPDEGAALPRGVVAFGARLDDEARWVAARAYEQARADAGEAGRRPLRALVLAGDGELWRRVAQAFDEAWRAAAGDAVTIDLDEATRERLAERVAELRPDALLLALDIDDARRIRLQLRDRGDHEREPVVWGTSQLSAGSIASLHQPELDGLRFAEMPWLLEPAHPAVSAYPPVAAEHAQAALQRLHALGIDAWRIAAELLAGRRAIELAGVTGRLLWQAGRTEVERVPSLAEYRGGAPVVLASALAPAPLAEAHGGDAQRRADLFRRLFR